MAGTDPRRLDRASGLDRLRVQTRDGTFLGHVFDLRCRWDKSEAGASIVEEIIYGRIGLAERLGFQVSKPDSVPWSRVSGISDRVIVVTLE